MRGMTKSAVRVARDTLAVGGRTFPAYGSRTSRHKFTLVADLGGTPKGSQATKGAAPLHPRLRSAPSPAGGGKRGVFHHAQVVILGWGRAAGPIDASPVAAVDATGLETRPVSERFGKRRGDGRGSGHRQRAPPKLTARGRQAQRRELILRVLAHNLMLLAETT